MGTFSKVYPGSTQGNERATGELTHREQLRVPLNDTVIPIEQVVQITQVKNTLCRG